MSRRDGLFGKRRTYRTICRVPNTTGSGTMARSGTSMGPWCSCWTTVLCRRITRIRCNANLETVEVDIDLEMAGESKALQLSVDEQRRWWSSGREWWSSDQELEDVRGASTSTLASQALRGLYLSGDSIWRLARRGSSCRLDQVPGSGSSPGSAEIHAHR